jgi:hypothetical protein
VVISSTKGENVKKRVKEAEVEALQLMSLYQEQQQLEFEREKFREHCATERRRHELAVKRLEHPELVAEEL